jgi:hypothetical protein
MNKEYQKELYTREIKLCRCMSREFKGHTWEGTLEKAYMDKNKKEQIISQRDRTRTHRRRMNNQ